MALVLTRKVGERVIITLPDGRKVEIAVTEVYGRRVKVSVTAPQDVPVYRSEIDPGAQTPGRSFAAA